MQKLKDSELRYRRLFEAAQDGILILDAETGMIGPAIIGGWQFSGKWGSKEGCP